MARPQLWVASVFLVGLATCPLPGQSEHIALPAIDWSNPVRIETIGTPTYFHRHRMEVEGVPWERQAIYQSSWAGEMGFRISGLRPEKHTLHLEYTEMDMNAPRRRVFDIFVNGEVVAREVCIFRAVGNRRVLAFDFDAVPINGAIEFMQRKSVPEADVPSFTYLRLYDAHGTVVAERSAWEMRPADWELRGYLDKIYFGPIRNDHNAPPWKGTYKIRAHETDRLTAADVVGPDGIAYPNWKHVGIPGGIPDVSTTDNALDFGAVPDDGIDDAPALQRAIHALQNAGGGVLLLPAGTYHLDNPIFIHGNRIVIRGEGMEKTHLISRFTMRGRPPEFHGFAPDQRIGPDSYIYVWADPEGLVQLDLVADGETVETIKRPGLWETQFVYRFPGSLLPNAPAERPSKLTAKITYRNGSTRETSITVHRSNSPVGAPRAYGVPGVITFHGDGPVGDPVKLAADGKRGATHLELASHHGLKTGDRIYLHAPTTEAWNKMTRNAHRGGDYRANQYMILAVDGDRIDIGEPLRMDFPTEAGAYIQKINPILRSGIEALSLEQTEDCMLHGIVIEYGWESWVKDIKVVRAGYKPLYMPNAKRCEVRDSIFDRVWYNSGGAGYVGWEHSFDCLMQDVITYDMRHAPVLQWASSGNVIRRSQFHNSDAQWHAGWTNENLYEELTVTASQDGGSYGNGGWASGPEDTGHGPNGPRNVVYNCDISSSKVGLWMGGMNEAWLIMYNRFTVGRGPAILAKAASFDHIIQGNTFVMMEPYPGAVYIGSEDCTGIELLNNRFFGPVGPLVAGPMRPAIDFDNRVLKSGDINRPHPPVRSIFEWQQAHK